MKQEYVDTINVNWKCSYIPESIKNKIKQDYYKQKHKQLENKLNSK